MGGVGRGGDDARGAGVAEGGEPASGCTVGVFESALGRGFGGEAGALGMPLGRVEGNGGGEVVRAVMNV